MKVQDKNITCPVGTYYNGLTCICGFYLTGDVVHCIGASPNVEIQYCNCMTYSEIFNRTLVGNCVYNCHRSSDLGLYYSIPNSTSKLNEATCGAYNRQGQSCSRCKNNHGTSVYTYDLFCTECTNFKYNWLKYSAVAFLPVTVLFLILLCCKLSINKSILRSNVLTGQLISSPKTACLLEIRRVHNGGSSGILFRIFFTVYGIWHLDFGRAIYEPFCLHPDLSMHHVIALDYLIAFYPLLLILLIYFLVKLHDRYRLVVIIWRPFYTCVRCIQKEWNIKASLIDVFATFILLSNVKLLNVSLDLISVPVTLWDVHGRSMPIRYTHINGSMEYLGKEHIPYFVLGIVVLLVFNIFPILLLCLYPFRWFQRCLNSFSLRNLSLHIFMDAFQGCYKTSPKDYRHFSALPLVIMLLNYIAFYVTTNNLYFTLLGLIFVTLSYIILVCKPFKVNEQNYVDGFVYLMAASLCFYQNSKKLIPSNRVFIQVIVKNIDTVLAALPSVILIVVLLHKSIHIVSTKLYPKMSQRLVEVYQERETERETDHLIPKL